LPASLDNNNAAVFDNELYVSNGITLWKTDGTVAGTQKVAGGQAGDSYVPWVRTAGGYLYYAVETNNSTTKFEPQGHIIAISSSDTQTTINGPGGDLTAGVESNQLDVQSAFYPHATYQYFTVNGTTATQVAAGSFNATGPAPADSVTAGNTQFFAFDDGVHGDELWSDDGSGGKLAEDIYPGGGSSSPNNLNVVNGHVAFAATTPSLISQGATLSGGVLFVSGSGANDTINISSNNGTTTVSIGGNTAMFNDADFSQIYVDGQAGDDTITIDSSITKSATIIGNTGNDTLSGSSGDDMIVGGDGNDVFDASSVGNDSFVGGAGNDTMDFSRRSTSISYDGDTGAAIVGSDGEHDLFSGVETLIGSQGNDTLEDVPFLYTDGSGGDDMIAYQGNQNVDPTIHGGDGNDTLNVKVFADFSDDDQFPGPRPLPAEVYGDAGNDTMLGSMSADNFFGGDGIDTIDYSQGIFASYTWDGNRWLPHFGAGVNISIDNKANDGAFGEENVHSDIEVIIGSSGPDTITTNGGNDTVIAAANDQVIQGPLVPPPVTTTGNNGGDTTTGNSGSDTISASAGPDNGTLPSLGSPDVLINGVLTITGSDTDDQIVISRSPGDPSMLKVLSNGGYGSIKLSQISKILVSAGGGNDLINFNEKYGAIPFPSTIYGGTGNDTITGGSEQDRIYGGDGNDWIEGSGGNDIIYGDAGNDRLFGGDGRDHIDGGIGTNVIRGEGGVDTIVSAIGDDVRGNKGDVLDQLQA
jgi:ELWxxDGT repeat protein